MENLSVSREQQATYLTGKRLYGDDLTREQAKAWLRDEREAYFNLTVDAVGAASYSYHALNKLHGFRYLPSMQRFPRILGLGAASGGELEPIAGLSDHIFVVEPHLGFNRKSIGSAACSYVAANQIDGLPFRSNAFDLVTCFGVLHHLPNVRTIIGEMARCLAIGGFALLREPVVSMGDWTRPRAGLTQHERGIPLALLRQMMIDSGLTVMRESLCMFALIGKLSRLLGTAPYNNPIIAAADALICRFFAKEPTYHATQMHQKIRPTSAFFVLQKT